MKIELESKPSYAMAIVHLDKGEVFVAESGAMAAMSTQIATDTKFNGAGKGGCLDFLTAGFTGLVRKFMAGETMFVNEFKSKADGQQVMLAPAMVGDIIDVDMDGGKKITVQSSSYLASTPNVWIRLVWGGFAMLFSGEGAFFLECTATGEGQHLLVNSYGGIEKVEIDGKYVVDNGHVVAWEGDLKMKRRMAGGFLASITSGEGMVVEFSGKGTLWLQTRDVGALVRWLTPMLPR